MLGATFAMMTALLAAAPAITRQPAAVQQDLNPDSSAAMCPDCEADRATVPWTMTRRDNPDSTVVEDEKAAGIQPSPTNDQINAAETGNPDSVDFRYSNRYSNPAGNGTWDLQSLEAESPDNAQAGRIASAVPTAAAKCSCRLSAARHSPAGGQR